VIARLRSLLATRARPWNRGLNDATREVIALSLSQLQRNRVIFGRARGRSSDRQGRSGAAAAGGTEPASKRVRRDERRRRSSAQLLIRTERDDGHRLRLSVQDTAPASILGRWTGCSTPSTRRSRTEWESASLSVARSSSAIVAALGNIERWSRPTVSSPFLSIPTACQMTTALAAFGRLLRRMRQGHEDPIEPPVTDSSS